MVKRNEMMVIIIYYIFFSLQYNYIFLRGTAGLNTICTCLLIMHKLII